jgi:3-hydroxybutyryl-CoA dehydratase
MYPFSTGDKFQHRFAVTPELYQGFINLFNDRNALHTDQGFAKEKGFRDCVVHGNVLNGFLSFGIGECLPVKNVIIHSQEIQFKKPVYLHDAVTLQMEVTDVHESVNAILFSFAFSNQEDLLVAKGKFQIGLLA